MSERKTVLKVLGVAVLIGLLLILAAGCGGSKTADNQQNQTGLQDLTNQQSNAQQSSTTQQAAITGPRVLLFSANW